MTWSEAWRLTSLLLTLPDSHVAVAANGWSWPESREAQLLADLFDLNHKVAAGKRTIKPHPRGTDPTPKRHGTASLSIDKMRQLLDRHRATGHNKSGGEVHG